MESPPPPFSAEEEPLKRNTDCVYFLASPLTCKKGSGCDYRHSEIARVNPRDCWFWLNGNCLNPKCGFRHPPLVGLLGTQMPTSSGSDQNRTPNSHVKNAASKAVVPCKFFQSGLCLKGDWCPFLHAPSPIENNSTSKKVEMSVYKKISPTNKGKPMKDSTVSRGMISGNNNGNFDTPKSVAELKKRNHYEPSGEWVMDQQKLSKRKYLALDGHQQNESHFSFDGLKPILKRKRGDPVGTLGKGNYSRRYYSR